MAEEDTVEEEAEVLLPMEDVMAAGAVAVPVTALSLQQHMHSKHVRQPTI